MDATRADPHRRPPRKPTAPPARMIVLNMLLTVPLATRFPRLQRLLDWPAHASRRSLLAGLTLHAALVFGIDAVVRAGDRWAREREDLKARLRAELGRPPWPEELDRAWRQAHGLAPDHPVPW